MRYAFVFLSIVAVWVAVVIMSAAAPGFSAGLAHAVAIVMTVVLFLIGFRRS